MPISTPEGQLERPARTIFVISDSTGETAEKVARAALRQFGEASQHVKVQIFPSIMDRASVERILKQAALQGAFVVTSLVSAEHRSFANELCKAWRLLHVDVIGSMIGGLSGWLGEQPANQPGLLHQADGEYFRRIEAIEFAIKVDDGKEPRMIAQADIVLVGVSRTSKTPLSVFLAFKGYKTANVPLVLGRDLPPLLYTIDPRRVFGLTIDPETLQGIRHSRLKAMRMTSSQNYADMDYILAELEYAEEVFRRNRQWTLLQMTNRAVEETAASILAMYNARGLGTSKGEVGQL